MTLQHGIFIHIQVELSHGCPGIAAGGKHLVYTIGDPAWSRFLELSIDSNHRSSVHYAMLIGILHFLHCEEAV